MKIITISREYGAGGLSIGTRVAEKLGLEVYNKDIIMAAAKASNVDVSEIAQEEEVISPVDNFLRSITPIYYDQKDHIFDMQSRAVIQLAQKGPCIIIGRCADYVLKEAGIEALHVFIYADMEARAKRASELLNTDDAAQIARVMKKMDKSRRNYYETYTDCRWGDYRNYDLMLNSSAFGYEKCAELICEAARE